LVNVPEVDCSYKFASGGIISNVKDLLKFANAMLYSYQSKGLGFLKFETVNELWNSKNVVEKMNDYVLGWYQWPVCCIDKDKENQIW
jgi:serine beta-lactamase-like protein LACTB